VRASESRSYEKSPKRIAFQAAHSKPVGVDLVADVAALGRARGRRRREQRAVAERGQEVRDTNPGRQRSVESGHAPAELVVQEDERRQGDRGSYRGVRHADV